VGGGGGLAVLETTGADCSTCIGPNPGLGPMHVEQSAPVVSNTACCICDVDVTVNARVRCLRFVRLLVVSFYYCLTVSTI